MLLDQSVQGSEGSFVFRPIRQKSRFCTMGRKTPDFFRACFKVQIANISFQSHESSYITVFQERNNNST